MQHTTRRAPRGPVVGGRGFGKGGLKIVIDFAMRIFHVGNLERPDLNSLAPRVPGDGGRATPLTPSGRTMAIYCMSERRKCVHNRHSDSRVGASLEMKTDRFAARTGRRGENVVVVVVVVPTGPKTTIWRLASL